MTTTPPSPNPRWLEWARELQSIAQSGLTYAVNPFDRLRYEQIRALSAQILAEYTQTDLPVLQNLLEAQSGYATPKVDVRGVVFQEGRILLVRELLDGGRWTLPGGWVDVGEPPSLAAEREVREEAGYEVKAVKLLAVFDRDMPDHGHPPYLFHTYKLFIRCEILGRTEADPTETAEPRFFGEDELPELSLLRVTPEELGRMFRHLRQPDLPTEFD